MTILPLKNEKLIKLNNKSENNFLNYKKNGKY